MKRLQRIPAWKCVSNRPQLCRLAAGAMLCLFVAAQAAAGPAYPLKQSPNGRYLVDQKNVPFMIVGDSPQAMVVNISEADAAVFFANRNARGFNTMCIDAICNPYTAGRTNASTMSGILPFTNYIPSTGFYDLTTPNEVYFARVDQILTLAAKQGLQVMLDPIETGGWLTTMLANGTGNCRAYGQYLGDRYKNFPNIIWFSGNDFQTWTTASDDAVVTSVALGIKDRDTNHIHTIELNYQVSSSLDDPNWAPIIGLNAAYTYFPTYAEVLHAYNQSSSMPVFMTEANYEFEDLLHNLGTLTPQILRQQEYWTMLSGAAGQLYGNHYTWQFTNGWQSHLDTPGAFQMGHLKTLFQSRAWYNLIPDTNHTVLTAGYGTFATNGPVNANDYATAAYTPDGTLVMAYLPTLRPVTVDMSNFSGLATAQWYDPVNGTYLPSKGAPFTNSGTRTFTPPGNNIGGGSDWVLVLASPPVPGTYKGLFSETNQVRQQQSSGSITTSVTSKGKYTGRLQMGTDTYSFAGALSPEGHVTNTIPRTKTGPLTLDLGFGTGDESDEIIGQITNSNWVAMLRGDRAVFNAKTNPAPYTNRFTLFIAGQPGDPSVPAGDGFGILRLNADGTGTFAGTLASGTPVSQGVSVSKDGLWPLYVPLFAGTGSLWGWLAFTNDTESDIDGMPAWIKPANALSRYFPVGFTNDFQVFGSVYVRPERPTNHILDLTNASVEFSGGNLAADFTNDVALGLNSQVTNLSGSNRFSMSFSLSTGTFRGHAADPVSGKTYAFAGAVLQKMIEGHGFLLGTNQSSRVVISP